MTDQLNDKEYLEYLVKGLVDYPEDVKIGREVDEMGVLLSLDLNPEDMGKVIGKRGNTAKAIRTLLRVVGMKNHARVTLKINEPEGSERPEKSDEGNIAEDAPSAAASVDQAMEDLKV